MTDLNCEEFRQVSPELALGVADARERAAALAHLERCPACRRETQQLSDVADALSALAPAAEPPAGFESRLLVALSRAKPSSPVRRLTPRVVWRVAAAAAVALLIGAGGWFVGDRGSQTPSVGTSHVVTAALINNQRPVGEMIIATGKDPWISMALSDELGAGDTVRCQLRLRGGGTVTVGTFSLSDRYGDYWAAALQPSTAPFDGAQVVDATGRVLAWASFPSQQW